MPQLVTDETHTFLPVFSGEVYTWGDNDEGQLGDGSTNAIQKPRLVAALQGFQFISHVFASVALDLLLAYLLPICYFGVSTLLVRYRVE